LTLVFHQMASSHPMGFGKIKSLLLHTFPKLDPGKNYRLSDSAIPFLRLIEYRGNIRELRDILNRAMVMSDTDELDHVAIELALPETGCV